MTEDTSKTAYAHYFPYYDDSAWGMACRGVGHQYIKSGATYPPLGLHPEPYRLSRTGGRRLKEWQLVYIVQGRGWFESEHCPQRNVGSGDVLVIFADEWHNYAHDPHHDWEEYWVCFRGDKISNRLSDGHISMDEPVVSGVELLVADFFEEMIRISDEERNGFQYELTGLIMHLTGLLITRYLQEESAEERLSPFVLRAKNMMYQRSGNWKNVSPEQIAKELGVGYTRFRRVFREETGIAPAQYQQELRLIRAKQLLQNRQMNIGDVSFELGFANQHQLSTFFRQRTGMTPKEWRECH